MAQLSIRVLGPFQVSLAGEPVSGFASDKVRALLAYLALSPDRPHRRETLSGLLWPEFPERSARTNLRNALANLRNVLGEHAGSRDGATPPPFLHSTHQTIQFNGQSDCWLDAIAFEELLRQDPPRSERLEQAVRLVRGPFLEGFSLADAAPFEEWLLLHREHLGRQLLEALGTLAAIHEGRGAYEQALAHARHRVELEPWQEAGQRQLMRLLARSGHRSQALAQYETLCRSLQEELGAEPAKETTGLYEQIRDGGLGAAVQLPPRPPDFVAEPPAFLEGRPVELERPVFVARDRELAKLNRCLDLALAGQGRVIFVTGQAGSGKTALVQEFSRRAQDAHAGLVVAGGNCNAYTGVGDPYLPFREILKLLTGDVEAMWAAGSISSEHARRLWHTLPVAIRALAEGGPDLVGSFISRAALLERARTYAQRPGEAGWRIDLDDLAERGAFRQAQDLAPGARAPGPQQSQLFKQYTHLLKALARQAPLVLVVDDLQWADAGSIHLLFHLGRQLACDPVLIVGAYRPEDVALGRDGARHRLEPVVHELQRESGETAVNVDRAGRQDFVEALLDSEPNRLGARFREMLHRQTRGHPLFTIELLRGLQERGDLVQDSEGCWVEGPALDWELLPARVEAVIAERIGRLARPLQATLRVASVEGEVFTAEVVARVRAIDEGELVGLLSDRLARRHHLVRAQGIERTGGQRLSLYRFRHILFQKYLYNSLDEVERAHLHEAVGNTLEVLYEDQVEAMAATAFTATVAGQLARHFQEAGTAEKAIRYLIRAGEKAVQLCAFREGIVHLTRGLEMLMALPDPGDEDQRLERAQQELTIQLALGKAWRGTKGYGPEAERAFAKARDLCRQTGDAYQQSQVLGRLAAVRIVRAEHQEALKYADEALSLAQQAGDPLLIAAGHWSRGAALFFLGEYQAARTQLEEMIAFYRPQHHHALVALRGSDNGTASRAFHACCLWCIGFPEQAHRQSQEAMSLARKLGHPLSLAEMVYFGGCLFHRLRRDGQALKNDAEELMRLVDEQNLLWKGQTVSFLGEALVMLGQTQEGMAHLREGIEACRRFDSLHHLPARLGSLAQAQARSGDPEKGLITLQEALALVEATSERLWEAELCRLNGELLLMKGDDAEAEASFQKAIEVARHQSARSWELPATTSLARLWQKQGKRSEARQVLAGIYGWFTEGFDTRDLKEARALLEELA